MAGLGKGDENWGQVKIWAHYRVQVKFRYKFAFLFTTYSLPKLQRRFICSKNVLLPKLANTESFFKHLLLIHMTCRFTLYLGLKFKDLCIFVLHLLIFSQLQLLQRKFNFTERQQQSITTRTSPQVHHHKYIITSTSSQLQHLNCPLILNQNLIKLLWSLKCSF